MINNTVENNYGAVQQGQNTSGYIDLSTIPMKDIESALDSLTSMVSALKEETDEADDISADIGTIRRELKKKTPSRGILVAAASSMRNIFEGAAGGVLANQAAQILTFIISHFKG